MSAIGNQKPDKLFGRPSTRPSGLEGIKNKNRIHAVLARHAISVPVSDLFGVKGRKFLQELEELPEVEKIVLTSNLKIL
ncbi:MAG: hypothetical protein IMW95_12680 [Moorella humiferrea]|nr:hypothetical protein [Moorella humiferrea]